MKIVVTGGAGLIGSYIVDQLVKEYMPKITIIDDFLAVVMIILNGQKKMEILKSFMGVYLTLIYCLKLFMMQNLFSYQAAIRITQCAKDNRLAHDVMCTGTFNVAEAAVKSGVKVIAASSASVYGQADVFPLKRITILITMIHSTEQQKFT